MHFLIGQVPSHEAQDTCDLTSFSCLAETEHAAGALRGPVNLFGNVTRGAIIRASRALPATEGELQDNEARLDAYRAGFEDYKAQSDARFEKYRNETTGIINALVDKTNTLTPVSSLLQVSFRHDNGYMSSSPHVCLDVHALVAMIYALSSLLHGKLGSVYCACMV